MIYTPKEGRSVYKTKDNVRVPSCTTITDVIRKPALERWNNTMGLKGIDTVKYVDELAQAGTLAHYFVECDIQEMERDPAFVAKFDDVDRARAETSLVKYHEWRVQHIIKVILVERELVSEVYRYGGKLDLLLEIDGMLTLVDIKTSKAIYDDQYTQVAGYWILAHELGFDIQKAGILRIGRNPDEGFEYREMEHVELQTRRFLACRELYEVSGLLKKAS
jgi:hypothetical protein